MLFVHPAHGERAVRLGYCTNLHAGESLPEIRAGLERFTLPVKRALGVTGAFGVGLYLPAEVALHLASTGGVDDLREFAGWLEKQGLDPFTFNAFPYGDFQRDGLKEAVYTPIWTEPERSGYTAAVAKVARALQVGEAGPSRHISISTHPGAHVSQLVDGARAEHHQKALAGAICDLVQAQEPGSPHVVLSVEAEPWAVAGNSVEMEGHLRETARLAQAWLVEHHGLERGEAQRRVDAHLGTCLDACHSAVEFESADDAVARARSVGSMGKLQYSNALSLRSPLEHGDSVAALLALDEPRFLHQVNGWTGSKMHRAADLPHLQRALQETQGRADWHGCEEWRCHFHVPVNLPEFAGLGTTQKHADAILEQLLQDPSSWKTNELHVEIETYTWNILPGAKPEGLVQGLVDEYGHVLNLLATGGWIPRARRGA